MPLARISYLRISRLTRSTARNRSPAAACTNDRGVDVATCTVVRRCVAALPIAPDASTAASARSSIARRIRFAAAAVALGGTSTGTTRLPVLGRGSTAVLAHVAAAILAGLACPTIQCRGTGGRSRAARPAKSLAGHRTLAQMIHARVLAVAAIPADKRPATAVAVVYRSADADCTCVGVGAGLVDLEPVLVLVVHRPRSDGDPVPRAEVHCRAADLEAAGVWDSPRLAPLEAWVLDVQVDSATEHFAGNGHAFGEVPCHHVPIALGGN